MTQYFHASKTLYVPGQSIGPFEECYYHTNAGVDSFINTYLDQDPHKPSGIVGRQQAIYLYNDLSNAISFTKPDSTWYYYRVIPKNLSGPFPMCLPELMATLGPTHEALASIAQEYWQPTYYWRHREFLCESAKVFRVVKQFPALKGAIGIVSLVQDRQTRDQLFNQTDTSLNVET